jgi:mRNA interferase MazF
VIVPGPTPIAILADQVKSLDWRTRKASFKSKVTAVMLAEGQAKLKLLSGI